MINVADAFCQEIEKAGLAPPERILGDGMLHRFASSGDHTDDAGWYIYFPDETPAGVFGCWRTGLKQTWSSKSDSMLTAAERERQRTRLNEARHQREQDEQLRHADAAQRARAIWDEAKPAPTNHGYLTKKQIQPHGLRVDTDHRLIVPVMIGGRMASLQTIDDAGEKRFLHGGKKASGSFTLGNLSEANTILICEGYATGASLYETGSFPVVVAFDAGNLRPVAEGLRQQYPMATILICGDNDIRDNETPNTGLDAATAAASAIDGILVMPELNGKKCDWNDVHTQCGLETLRRTIEAALIRAQETDPATPATIGSLGGPEGWTVALANEILRTEHFCKDAGGALSVFVGGVYRPGGEQTITRLVKHLLNASGFACKWTIRKQREVLAYLTVDAPVLWDRPPLDTLNLQNGLFDLNTHTLRPHSPDHRSLIQLPLIYDPTATCDEWEAFVGDVFPEDSHTLAYEIVAWLLCPDTSMQKAFLLRGDGANGKSTYLSAVTAALGAENVSGLSLQKLESDRFSTCRLLGKLANICSDLPSDHLTSTSIFKSLVGGDRITGEYKFGASFDFLPFVRILVSANHFPTSKDSSHAFFRRWIVIPFDCLITEAQKRAKPDILARLTRSTELSGLLNRCLAVLPALRQRGGFVQTHTTLLAHKEFQAATDPLAVWLDRHTVLDPNGMMVKSDLSLLYSAESEQEGRPLVPAKTLYAGIKRLRPTVYEGQRRENGTPRKVFIGIRLQDPVFAVPAVPAFPYLTRTLTHKENKEEKRILSEKCGYSEYTGAPPIEYGVMGTPTVRDPTEPPVTTLDGLFGEEVIYDDD